MPVAVTLPPFCTVTLDAVPATVIMPATLAPVSVPPAATVSEAPAASDTPEAFPPLFRVSIPPL